MSVNQMSRSEAQIIPESLIDTRIGYYLREPVGFDGVDKDGGYTILVEMPRSSRILNPVNEIAGYALSPRHSSERGVTLTLEPLTVGMCRPVRLVPDDQGIWCGRFSNETIPRAEIPMGILTPEAVIALGYSALTGKLMAWGIDPQLGSKK